MRVKPIPIEKQYQLVLECRQSGLSDYNWCLDHDIKPGTFYIGVGYLNFFAHHDMMNKILPFW